MIALKSSGIRSLSDTSDLTTDSSTRPLKSAEQTAKSAPMSMWRPFTRLPLDVQVRHLQRVSNNELPARLDHVPHQRAEHLCRVLRVPDLYLQ
jgi:hypothetical protein